MAAVDPRVQQADARNLVSGGRELRSRQQLVQPFQLLLRPQRAEELGGFLGPPKLSDAVEREDRALHLLQGRGHQQHRALGKDQLTRRNAHSLRGSPLPKRCEQRLPVPSDRQPHFPPERALILGGKPGIGVGP